MPANVIDLLIERGFIDAMTSDELRNHVNRPIKLYCGFDPTSDSLHIGNLVGIMALAWFQKFGHTPVAIVGGATGMIGDPSGKSVERQLLNDEAIQHNLQGIRKNLEQILDFNHPTAKPEILNNNDWFKSFSLINFLRDVGKLFRIGPMLAKDSVKSRLNSEEGMSFTEFSYQILQSYDFLHLYEHHKVCLQVGGSDQWGNITAGTELIRKVLGKSAFGLTFRLLTRSDGQKFGKSEKGAVWLSAEKLSPYEFYQYFVRSADADVILLMKMLTFMDMQDILKWEAQMKEPDYLPNTAQRKLAREVTRIVHGEDGLQMALKITEGANPGSEAILNADVLENIAVAGMPSFELSRDSLLDAKVIDVLVQVGLQISKGDARRLVRNGGAFINNQKVEDENTTISLDHLIDGKILLLAAGKKNKVIIRIK